jgi:TolB-like protein/DNA-binding winged helix-turn-helix (wHTH) protein/Tfp pilus assembly protein PilF
MSAESWYFEDFELDPSAYRLRRDGEVVRLERIPFELICLLIEQRGRVVTREEILERVWGKGVFIDSENSINSAVRKIRRALNDDADAPRFIVTVPARGYRFVASIHETKGTATIAQGGASASVSAVNAAPPELEEPGPRRWRQVAAVLVGLALSAVLIPLALYHPPRSAGPAVVTHSAQTPPLPLPDKPSIAVLPFTNLSGDREQEYFSDGITDDLITALSRLPGLFVIARSSAFTYKGMAVKVQDVGREPGVRYLLEGSVRMADNQVRITAQLVDAASGEHLWAEHYDRPLRDVFGLQDEIVRRIVTTLNLQLDLWDKHGLLVTKRTDNLEAYDDFLRGLEYCQSATKAGNEQARRLYQKAIEVDPNYSDAFANLAFTYLLEWAWQWSQGPHDLDRALELGQHSTALDDTQSLAHALLGATYLYRRQHDQALAEGQRAIDLDPNFAPAYLWMAETLTYSGKPAEAVGVAQKAMRLDPRNQDSYLVEIGRAYNELGRYTEAVPVLERNVARYPNSLAGHSLLLNAYVELGREADGRAEVAEVMRISPRASVEGFERINPDIDRASVEGRAADQRKAGLRESTR